MRRKLISDEVYQKLTALKWDNPHTKRFRRLLGDPQCAVAWCSWWELNKNPAPGCWVFGALRPVTVKSSGNLKVEGVAHQEDIYIPMLPLADWDGNPKTMAVALPISDSRLPAYIRSCDKAQQSKAVSFDEAQRYNEEQAAKEKKARQDERIQRMKSLRNLARKEIGDPFFHGSMDAQYKPKQKAGVSTYIIGPDGKPARKDAA